MTTESKELTYIFSPGDAARAYLDGFMSYDEALPICERYTGQLLGKEIIGMRGDAIGRGPGRGQSDMISQLRDPHYMKGAFYGAILMAYNETIFFQGVAEHWKRLILKRAFINRRAQIINEGIADEDLPDLDDEHDRLTEAINMLNLRAFPQYAPVFRR